jgi:hypothetical protein
MRNQFTRIHLVVIAAGIFAGMVPPVLAQETIYSTLGAGDAYDTNNFVQFTNGFLSGRADRFTSLVTAEVGDVSLALEAVSAGSTITLTIRSESANGPGGVIGTFNSTPISTDPGVVTFAATDAFQLDAGTEYWVTAIASNGQTDWFLNDQGIENFGASHTGISWTVDQVGSTGLAFEVDGVPEPGTLALGVVGLAACCGRRARALTGS